MFNKPFTEISEEDIALLITNGVPESRDIDYKRDLMGTQDADKQEFLADISAFANTNGGYIVFGINEAGGLPTAINPITVPNQDQYVLAMDSLVRSGIAPRMTLSHRFIPVSGGFVLILKIERSLLRPHRVTFRGHDRFYMRGAAGKFQMDVTQLRSSFTESATLHGQIKSFYQERVAMIAAAETPIPLEETAKLTLHIVPLSAFSTEQRLDPSPHLEDQDLRPMLTHSYSRRLNLEGILKYSGREPAVSYTQFYRSGTIEAVCSHILGYEAREEDGKVYIPSQLYEEEVRDALLRYLKFLKKANINPPVVVFLTLIGAKGHWMSTGGGRFFMGDYVPLDRDMLSLPEAYIEDLDIDVDTILRPMFDLIWNCCGYPRSFNYDDTGVWNPR